MKWDDLARFGCVLPGSLTAASPPARNWTGGEALWRVGEPRRTHQHSVDTLVSRPIKEVS